MKIAKEEIFGPVVTVYKFDDEKEAIDMLNSTEFGLSGSVFTKDYTKAERISKQLKVGMCNVNGWGVNYLCQVITSSVSLFVYLGIANVMTLLHLHLH